MSSVPIKPCVQCGAQDRIRPRPGRKVGECRPCSRRRAQAFRAKRVKKPCPSCSQFDWNESGNCRTCQKNQAEALAESGRPCRRCGGTNRFPNGNCRDCSARNLIKSRQSRMDDPCSICGGREKTPSGVCLACSRRYNRENAVAMKAYDAARRARLLASPERYTAQELRDQFKAQKGRCHWCHKSVGSKRTNWHADHVIALARGGTNDIGNIVVSCARCNLQKSAQMPWEFAGRLF